MKLTPLDLSKDPLPLGIDTQTYDFGTQKRTCADSPLTLAGRSTQTHDSHGKAIDSDAD
jgi:hypothetical protein